MVDERDLEIKTTSLRALLATERELINKISQVLTSLDAIRLKEDGTPKTDTATGAPMSEARRQEIYDACTAAAQKIIDGYYTAIVSPPLDLPADPPASE